MAQIKLTNYINKIEECYTKVRAEYETIENKINENEKKYRSVDRSIYTPAGLAKIENEYSENKKSLYKELANVRETFNKETQKIIAGSNELFNKKYNFTPTDIDNNGLAIINNANLSEKEIIKLCDSYLKNDNATMYYLCAEKLKESKDVNARKYYNNARYMRENRPDNVIFNAMQELCIKGLRDDFTLANGIHKKHNELLNTIVRDADNIQVAVDDVWSE